MDGGNKPLGCPACCCDESGMNHPSEADLYLAPLSLTLPLSLSAQIVTYPKDPS